MLQTLIQKIILCVLFISSPVFAQTALFHMQGESGDREMYFADFRVVSDRTPMNMIFGPFSVKELDVTAVYENAAKPEYVVMHLQFECVNKYAFDEKNIPKQPGFNDPVNMRMAENSYMLRRSDLKSQAVPSSDWKKTSSPMLLKAAKIACNDDVMHSAVKAALNKRAKQFELEKFNKKINKIGLPSDFYMVSYSTPPEFLDFAWQVAWWPKKRPDPTGKWSSYPTKKEWAEYQKKMAELEGSIQSAAQTMKEDLEANIAEMQAEFDFKDEAAKIQGKRKLNRYEYNLIQVWLGKTEADVVKKMGNPAVNEAGNMRFLDYANEFSNKSVVVDMKSGAAWEEGIYSRCNFQFIFIPDKSSAWRVADVRVWASGDASFTCSGFAEVPD